MAHAPEKEKRANYYYYYYLVAKERICGVTSSTKYELLLVFCFVVVVLFRSHFVSALRSSRHHATLSEHLKICQKLQYRAALNKLKINTQI